MDKLQAIIQERPQFHKGETEISRPFSNSESLLSQATIKKMSSDELTCYAIGSEVLSFIAANVTEGNKTLETGAGSSTLVFAACGCQHTAVTPSVREVELISQYAASKDISMSRVQFVNEPSDTFLPRNTDDGYDMVLIDGKHAFPWPLLDWFYTAEKLKQGGLMIIDDVAMKSVSVLTNFLKTDTAWSQITNVSANTFVFKKMKPSVHDVAWHMQPYAFTNPVERIGRRIRQVLKSK